MKLKRFNMVKVYAAMVLTFAIRRGLIDKNPFYLVEIPIVKGKFHLKMRKMITFILVNNEIRINKAVARGKEGLFVPTKNGLPRTLKMDDKSMELLKMWKKKQAEKYLERVFNTLKKINLYFQIQ